MYPSEISQRARSLVDKMSVSGTEDRGFDSHRAHFQQPVVTVIVQLAIIHL
ncbi:MAG: hypothetical protein UY13_C0002G0163 [Candidatus Pacebacteria bacterium GW2011_GWB1_47_8]|nr:MAG: hypothetical protein UX28_C0001G0312 [Candidatus Pacebacteria bacterium GW2011_GWA1_46_10]KKU84251.1 MAG: hypothetical protein UY13_C0002G0163 [Candidatus Pacebacteria bacterium GW2011_GWB1_47_8]